MLRHREDIRTLAFVASWYVLFALGWFWDPDLPLAIPLFIALGSFSWFCAVITHNVIHAPVFYGRGLNRAFQVVLTLTYGHPVSAFVPGHNLSHHKYTQTPRDVMRTTKVRYRWNLLNGLMFFFSVGGSIMKGDVGFGVAMRKHRPAWFRQFMLEAGIFVALSAVFLVLDWRKFLVWWYLPHFWAAWGIVTINFLQHDGADADHPYNHSRNFTGRFFGWWTFNNGFHAAHHIEAGRHWSKLREMHDTEVAPHIDPRLCEPSIAAYIWRTFLWPAKRVRYDGTPVVLPPPAPDESWVPSRAETPSDVSLGAVA